MDTQLFRLTLNIRAYHENQMKRMWSALSAPSVGDHVHTHKAEYKVTAVHWPTTEEMQPHPVPVNLDMELIATKEPKS